MTVRTWLIELLLCVDLLGKTVQFLHEIRDITSLDSQDKMKWKDLENVYSEVEKEFVCLYNDCHYEFTQSALTCELPTLTQNVLEGLSIIFQKRS